MRYNFLRNVKEQWYHFDSGKKSLAIKLRPETCSGKQNPSFIGFKQSHLKGYAEVALLFETSLENEKAGLMVFQNENHFYFLCMSVENSHSVVQLYKGPGNGNVGMAPELLASAKIDMTVITNLKIEANGKTYSFYYAQKKSGWVMLKENVDAKFLSTKVAGGFVGCMYAMYATSSGEPSANMAHFNCFCYEGDDDIYKNK
jgi:alpha-N-arabinofuranosidase